MPPNVMRRAVGPVPPPAPLSMDTVTGVVALQRTVSEAVALSAVVMFDALPKFSDVADIVQVERTRACTVSDPVAENCFEAAIAAHVPLVEPPNKLNAASVKVDEKVPGAAVEEAGERRTTLKGNVTVPEPLPGRTTDRGPERGHVVSMPTCVAAPTGL